MTKCSILLVVFMIITAFSFADPGDSPGDLWVVVPEGVQQGEQFTLEIHVNTGTQNIAAYTFDIHLDFRYLRIDDGAGGFDPGPDGFLTVAAQGDTFYICQGFVARGTGPGSDLYLVEVHCIALEKGPSLIGLEVDHMVDENTNIIGTPRGFDTCFTIGSNGIAGDANQSGELTIVDALLVAQYYTFTKLTTAIDTSVTDVNQDGYIDIVDALLIAQYYVGLIGPLPITGTPGPPLSPAPTPAEATPTPIIVQFPDPELEAAVRYDLMIPTGEPIYAQDVENVNALYFNYERITDLTGMEYFTSLTHLYLGNNKIRDLSPLADLSNLTRLDIQDNDISDLSPLANLTNLTSLIASGNTISDLTPLASLSGLEELSLEQNSISDITPLAALINLTSLALNNNTISDIEPLSHLTNVTSLNLSDNLISDLSPLAELTQMTILYLENNAISDVNPLFSLIKLRSLYLSENPILQTRIDALKSALPDTRIIF
ncbi:MAG: leucine-rich repeat domain-containing protein [Spirochaetales bacterium]|nr:leucine-rich repeat domain-containing protein [Spirochaetales bacterium]